LYCIDNQYVKVINGVFFALVIQSLKGSNGSWPEILVILTSV